MEVTDKEEEGEEKESDRTKYQKTINHFVEDSEEEESDCDCDSLVPLVCDLESWNQIKELLEQMARYYLSITSFLSSQPFLTTLSCRGDLSSSQLDLLFSQLGGELVEGGKGKGVLEGEEDVARKGGLEGEEDVGRKGGLWHFLEEECGLEEREEVAGLLLPAAAALAHNLGQVKTAVLS